MGTVLASALLWYSVPSSCHLLPAHHISPMEKSSIAWSWSSPIRFYFVPQHSSLMEGKCNEADFKGITESAGPGSAPGSPLGARSKPPPPRAAVTPALGDTGHEWRRDGRPRVGAGAKRNGSAEAGGARSPARRRGRRGARREPQSRRRHFSVWQRRGLGRGDSGHGERLRLRLRLRRRRRGEAGPGAHHGAGEGADRRGQRPGALTADDGQVLSEVHREARRRPGQFRAEVHRHVHGPVYGLLEHSFASLQFSAAAGESQHVTPAGLRAQRDHVGKVQRPVQVVRGESCCLPSPCHGRAIKPR